jgi:hypothetical protein
MKFGVFSGALAAFGATCPMPLAFAALRTVGVSGFTGGGETRVRVLTGWLKPK